MPTLRNQLLFVAVALLAGLSSACTSKDGPLVILEPPKHSAFAPGAARVMEQLAPVKVRVHPLTRVSIEKDEPIKLACHIELLDQFDHAIKWLGAVRIELYRPVSDGGGISGSESQDRIWNQDLNDPQVNASFYDWVTRTYKLELGELPAWAARVADGTGRDPWLTLKVYFTYIDVGGVERTLSAVHRIERGR